MWSEKVLEILIVGILTLAMILLLAVVVRAEEAPLYVVRVQGQGALALPETMKLLSEVSKFYKREVGVTFRAVKIKRLRRYPFSDGQTLATAEQQLNRWEYWLYRNVSSRRLGKVVKLIIVPPFAEDNKLWVLGWSSMLCGYDNPYAVAFIAATMRNAEGLPRYWYSVAAASHELGHMLGADEDNDSCTIMDSAALSCFSSTTQYLPMSGKSRSEIKSCLWGL